MQYTGLLAKLLIFPFSRVKYRNINLITYFFGVTMNNGTRLLLIVLCLMPSITLQGMEYAQVTYIAPTDYQEEVISELCSQLKFYSNLSAELAQYEKHIDNKFNRWFSKVPAGIIGTIGSVWGAQKIIESMNSQGAFRGASCDSERIFIKGYIGTVMSIIFCSVGYVAGSTLLNQLISKPLSRCNTVRYLLTYNRHAATDYLKQRLEQTKKTIAYICRQLPLKYVDKIRQSLESEPQKELLLDISQDILQERKHALLPH